MVDEALPPALERIDHALARIEAAGRRSADLRRAIELRHTALRARIVDAIDALDTMIAEADD